VHCRIIWLYDPVNRVLEETDQVVGFINVPTGIFGEQSVIDLVIIYLLQSSNIG
jgi:hypothetical protein